MDKFRGKLKRWNEKETTGLMEIRARLGSLLTCRPQFPEVVGDRKLLRFFRGIKYFPYLRRNLLVENIFHIEQATITM